jgi:flavodoxin
LRLVVAVFAGVAVTALLLGYMAAQEGSAAQEEGAAAAPAKEAPPASEVVIVWCGGTPGAPSIPAPEAGAVDAVTQATPEAGNVKEIAEKLGKELEAAGHSATVIAAEQCRDPQVIMHAKALILGCPDYFGLPPWQMVRFFDETLYRLYRGRVRLSGHVVTAFATTERCRGILEGVLKGTGGKAVEGAVIAPRGTSAADRDASVKQLAARIVAGL